MLKITGLDKLQKDLKDASRAMQGLNGQIAEVRFDPSDPTSVNAAVRTMERAVDQKAAPYRNNPLVAEMVKGVKANYRASIMEQARKARRA
jgi:hypothetical protein